MYSLLFLSLCEGCQHALRNHWLLCEPGTGRVMDGDGDRRGKARQRHLCHATCSKWPVRVGQFQDDRRHFHRHVEHCGQEIRAQVRSEDAPVAHLQVFEQRIAEGLCQTAFDLPLDLLRVDGTPHVMCANNTQNLHLTCERVDLHLHCL